MDKNINKDDLAIYKLIDEGVLCSYCPRTEYGEVNIFCEDDGDCDVAYDHYLNENKEEE